MRYPQRMEAKGLWYTKVIIGVLTLLLISSVLYPDHLWKRHDKLIQDSRERMENINYVSERFHKVTGEYTANVDSLINFMRTDSMVVEKSFFEIEKLSLYDANYDSLLIGFTDLYHFDRIEVDSFDVDEDSNTDSIVVKMMPKKLYADVINPVEMAFAGPRGVKFFWRDAGEDDIYWIVWSPGKMKRTDLPYELRRVPSKDYLLFRDLDDLAIDPISGDTFMIFKNARITLTAEVNYTRTEGPGDSTLIEDELHTNLFINRLARKARSRLEQDIQRDSTLAVNQLAIQGDYYDMELTLLRPGKSIAVSSDRERTIPMDSVGTYDEKKIQADLFKITYDSLIHAWMKLEKTQEVLTSLTYDEKYDVSDPKVIGVTIRPPFDKSYPLRDANLLDMIFSVGKVDYPGWVENNDLSWEEKR